MSNKKPILLLGGIGAVTGLAAIGAAIYLNVNSSDPKDIRRADITIGRCIWNNANPENS